MKEVLFWCLKEIELNRSRTLLNDIEIFIILSLSFEKTDEVFIHQEVSCCIKDIYVQFLGESLQNLEKIVGSLSLLTDKSYIG